jgi:hypothetical protein
MRWSIALLLAAQAALAAEEPVVLAQRTAADFTPAAITARGFG